MVQRYVNEVANSKECRLAETGKIFNSFGYGFAFPFDNPDFIAFSQVRSGVGWKGLGLRLGGGGVEPLSLRKRTCAHLIQPKLNPIQPNLNCRAAFSPETHMHAHAHMDTNTRTLYVSPSVLTPLSLSLSFLCLAHYN